MTPDLAAMVARLRNCADDSGQDLRSLAADTIESLAAENVRLRQTSGTFEHNTLLARAERAEAERDALRKESLRVAGERMGDDAYIEGLTLDAERYRFLRSPLASEYGIVQKEFWEKFSYKLCREEKLDALVDGAMKLLRRQIDAAIREAAK